MNTIKKSEFFSCWTLSCKWIDFNVAFNLLVLFSFYPMLCFCDSTMTAHGYECKNPFEKKKNDNFFWDCMMMGISEKNNKNLLVVFGILRWWHMGMKEKSPPKITKMMISFEIYGDGYQWEN